jgi:hypothetical protein
MLLTSPLLDICFEAIVLSPIKSCHVTSWTQKVRSTQRWQPKRSTVGSQDQIWQIRSWHSSNTWNRLDAHEDPPKSKFDHAEVTSLVLLASYFALRHVVFCVFRSNGAFVTCLPCVCNPKQSMNHEQQCCKAKRAFCLPCDSRLR